MSDELPEGRDLGPVQIGCKRCGKVHWGDERIGECQPRRPIVRAKPAAIARRLGAIRKALGWPEPTAEERERNLAAFIDELEDA